MAIHTSSNTYSRGVPKNQMYNAFFLTAQANNTIPVPMSKYLARYSFYNRNAVNTTNQKKYLWSML